MPGKHRASRHRPAIGSPLFEGQSRPRRKHDRRDYRNVIAIVAAGVLLAYLTRTQRGHVALIVGCLSVLVATGYWHRRGQVAQVAGVAVVALVLGMALVLTPATRPAARGFTAQASVASETVTAGAVTTVGGGAGWVLDKLAALASRWVKP